MDSVFDTESLLDDGPLLGVNTVLIIIISIAAFTLHAIIEITPQSLTLDESLLESTNIPEYDSMRGVVQKEEEKRHLLSLQQAKKIGLARERRRREEAQRAVCREEKEITRKKVLMRRRIRDVALELRSEDSAILV